uniref:40S ribosomal protein S24 n=1 Tax=Kwoniella pini CBS 10737 TaxID=1296096 RepID=A0A1B9I8I1_9TREE|nr:30S small subunit ribosomal protein S24e [Kwoniella pini CBS 10737]OCF51805.1 30S small subunit ribosomal protein S24e [Kwoniella pini CBS 10737]
MVMERIISLYGKLFGSELVEIRRRELGTTKEIPSIALSCHSADPQGPVTIRTTQFITNRLLNRRQFIVTIFHPTRANISRSELGEKLAGLYKTEAARVSVFGLKTKFGGGVSTGFGLIYDDEESQKKFEPKHRLVRSGLADKVVKASRKLRKERKNRSKKVRGKAKTKAAEPAKKK